MRICMFLVPLAAVLLLTPSLCVAQCRVSDPCCIPSTGDLHLPNGVRFPVALTQLSRVRSCLRGLATLPYALRSDVASGLQSRLANMYAFFDLARNSSDTDACLTRYDIHRLAYNSEPAFNAAINDATTLGYYQALSRAFRGFNDAHTRLFTPLQAFHYIRPLFLSVRMSTAQVPEVYVAGINPLYALLNASTVLGQTVDLSSYTGRVVTQINGQSALAYLQAQANNFGFHKSPGVRFNQLLKQTYFSLGEHDLPATDVETYVISGIAGTVGIPLAAVVTDPRITTSTQQVSQFTQSEENSIVANSTQSSILDSALAYDEAITLSRQQSSWALQPLNISFGNVVPVFEVNNAIIMKLPGGFGISQDNSQLTFQLMMTFIRVTEYAQRQGIRTIMFDVVGTNGGALAFSNWLLGALITSYRSNPEQLCESYDVRTSPLWDQWANTYALRPWVNAVGNLSIAQMEELFEMVVTRKADFIRLFDLDLSSFYVTDVNPQLVQRLEEAMTSTSDQNKQLAAVKEHLKSFFTKPPYSLSTRNIEWYPLTQRLRPVRGQPPYSNLSYYRNPVMYRRGGIRAGYSQKFFQSCVSALSGTFSLWQRVRTSFQNILFLTDGTCGGACSLLLSKLQVEGRARVASFGGIVGQRMDTSFAGGYIENWPEEFEKVRLSELIGNIIFNSNTTTFPELSKLPIPAAFTMAAFELYISRLGSCALPRDWYNIPAQGHINTWATRIDDWPTTQHVALRQLYVDAIQGLLGAPTTSSPIATTSGHHGLNSGVLTAVLIICIAVGVILTIVGYIYVRKRMGRPLMPGQGSVVGSTPLLDDKIQSNDDIWPEQE